MGLFMKFQLGDCLGFRVWGFRGLFFRGLGVLWFGFRVWGLGYVYVH